MKSHLYYMVVAASDSDRQNAAEAYTAAGFEQWQIPAEISSYVFAELLVCKGPCLKAFHPACLGMHQPADMSPGAQAAWFCPECLHGRVRCFVCGEFGAGLEDPTLRKCSLGVCGRFYHIKYALHTLQCICCPMHLDC